MATGHQRPYDQSISALLSQSHRSQRAFKVHIPPLDVLPIHRLVPNKHSPTDPTHVIPRNMIHLPHRKGVPQPLLQYTRVCPVLCQNLIPRLIKRRPPSELDDQAKSQHGHDSRLQRERPQAESTQVVSLLQFAALRHDLHDQSQRADDVVHESNNAPNQCTHQ